MGFCLGLFRVVVEVTYAEGFKSNSGVGTGGMYKLERGRDLAAKAAWYVVDHLSGMLNSPEPVLTGHLLLREVGPRHLDNSLPGVFNETV